MKEISTHWTFIIGDWSTVLPRKSWSKFYGENWHMSFANWDANFFTGLTPWGGGGSVSQIISSRGCRRVGKVRRSSQMLPSAISTLPQSARGFIGILWLNTHSKKRSPCLEASNTVVHIERGVVGVVFCQWVDCDIIVWKTNRANRVWKN